MKTVPLGDVARWGSGGTPSRSNPDYFGSGLPWVSIADLNDSFVEAAKESLTVSGLANSSAKAVPEGSVLVAMYGSIGKLGIAAREVCTSQAIAFAVPDRERLDGRYLFHFLRHERPRLQSRGRGGTQMNISQGDLKSWPIPLPGLSQQRRIVAILDQADAIHTMRRASLGALAELPIILYRQRFGHRLQSDGPSELWTLGDAFSFKSGASLPSRSRRDGVVPVFGANGVIGWHDVATEVGPAVLVGRVGAAGAVNVAQGPFWPSDNVLVVKCLSRDLPVEYVKCALIEARLDQYASKSAQPLISTSRIKDHVIRVPTQGEAELFARDVREIRAHQERVERQLAADEELFASLQARAFRGEL